MATRQQLVLEIVSDETDATTGIRKVKAETKGMGQETDKASAKVKKNTRAMEVQARALRRAGNSWADVGRKMGVSEKTAAKLGQTVSKTTGRVVSDGKRIQRSNLATERSNRKVGSSFKNTAKTALGLVGAYVSFSEARAAVNTTVEIGKATLGLHRNLGLTIRTASKWAAVAKARSIDNKSLTMSFTTLSRGVEKARQGGEQQIKMFRRLGLSQADLREGSRDFNGLILKVADGLGRLRGGTERQAIAQQLLGRGYQTILPLFAEGSKSLREQTALAEKYGATLGVKTAGDVQKLIASQREAKFATLGMQVAFGTTLAPVLTDVIGRFGVMFNQIRTGKGAIGEFSTGIKGAATSALSFLVPMAAVTGKVVEFGGHLLTTRAGMIVMAATVGALTGRLIGLGVAWGVEKIAGFITGMREAALAVRGLGVATSTTPLTAFLTLLGLVAGAVLAFSGGTSTAKRHQEAFKNALDNSRSALDQYRTAIDNVKDGQLQHRQAVLNLRAAEQELDRLRKTGGGTRLQLKQGELAVAQARQELHRSTRDLGTAEARLPEEQKKTTDELRKSLPVIADRNRREQNTIDVLRRSIAQGRAAGQSDDQLRGKIRALRDMERQHSDTTRTMSGRLREMGLSGLSAKDRLKVLRDVIRNSQVEAGGYSLKLGDLKSALRGLPALTKVKIAASLAFDAAGGALSGFGGGGSGERSMKIPTSGQLLGGIKEASKDNLLTKIKDDPSTFFNLGLGGGRAKVDAFTPIASRFGLTMTSGFRPGDPGWHGQNRARDYSNGYATPQELRFAKFMYSGFGRNLLELIHTPMGIGIKNGQPVNIRSFYGAKVAADHYDHVHVAARAGRRMDPHLARRATVVYGEDAPRYPEYFIPTNPRYKDRAMGLLAQAQAEIAGVRDMRFYRGGGRRPDYGKADPPFSNIEVAAMAYRAAGFRGKALQRMIAISGRETGGTWDPKAGPNVNTNGTRDWGLSQINDTWKKDPIVGPMWGGRENPYTNARMAWRVLQKQGWSAWATFNDSGYQQYLDDATKALVSTRGVTGGHAGGGGTDKVLTDAPTANDRAKARRQRRRAARRRANAPVVREKGRDPIGSELGFGPGPTKGQSFTPTRFPRGEEPVWPDAGEADTSTQDAILAVLQEIRDLDAERGASQRRAEAMIRAQSGDLRNALLAFVTGSIGESIRATSALPSTPGKVSALDL